MEFRLEEDEVYFREEEEYGIIYSKKNKSFFKIPALIAQELRELKNRRKILIIRISLHCLIFQN